MKKNILLISIACLICTTISGLIIFSDKGPSFYTKAINKEYQITFNSSKNKFFNGTGTTSQSGDATIKTDLGNDVGFSFSNLAGGSSSVWHLVKSDGYFYNTAPILGMSQLSVQFTAADKAYKIYWSADTTFIEERSRSFQSEESESIFNFGGYYPKYFKFVNTSGSNLSISNLSIKLICQNTYPQVNLTSENEAMGCVSGGGAKHAGDNVTIVATPNSGYKFVGWYSGETLISYLESYSFVIGNDDLDYVAKFAHESYNLIIQSESSEKGKTSNSSGTYDYLTEITISASANAGYTFDGWYEGNSLISHDNPYTFEMPYSNKTYTAKFTTNSYSVGLTNNNPTLGDISGDGVYLYGSNVALTATPNIGVSFLGWYDGENLISTSNPYVFSMPHYDFSYVAKFDWTPYSITLTINDSTMGSVSGGGSYTYGQEVTLTATPNEHYSFFGWYSGNTLLSSNSTYIFEMPVESLSYEARFVKNYYLIVYSDDESMGTVTSPSECGAGLEVTVVANANDGYAIDYWADENYDEVSYDFSYTFVMPSHNVELIAVFDIGYSLTVISNNNNLGTASGSGKYKGGRQVNLTITLLTSSSVFLGWFDENNHLLSKNSEFMITTPSYDYCVIALFSTHQVEYEKWKKNHGVIPVLSSDEKTVTFGLYPQQNVADELLIQTLNEDASLTLNDWYLYDGDYYIKKVASCRDYNSSTYRFDNGEKIIHGATYWFKCEPISWRVLKKNNNTYLLLSDFLLDAKPFYNTHSTVYKNGKWYHANDYENSIIRSWLNNDFYDIAFALNNTIINNTIIDNSASTTNSNDNPYCCSDTEDKVFLLSYKDYLNENYGFSNSPNSSSTRFCKTTDWARANKAYSYVYNSNYSYSVPEYHNNGIYWMRSPYYEKKSNYDNQVWSIGEDGGTGWADPDYDDVCIRPAIIISTQL